MSTWIFVRHGESEANLLHEFSNHGIKHGLTKLGIQQSTILSEKLIDYPVKAIYCSPLLRALQTAQIIGDRFRIGPQATPALIEFDTGVLEGKSDEKSWMIYQEIFQDWIINRNFERQFDGGDSFNSIRSRFLPFVNMLQDKYSKGDQAILLVGHGGTFICMLPVIIRNIDFEFAATRRLSNTGMVIVEEQKGEFICRVWDGQVII
ncbi:MAG TPA: histidine phosphatase family protein [Longilinea sp.]|nr:histidine phosphatase family protein [Longilinea sp.]